MVLRGVFKVFDSPSPGGLLTSAYHRSGGGKGCEPRETEPEAGLAHFLNFFNANTKAIRHNQIPVRKNKHKKEAVASTF